jgi:hypothetical protein
VQYQGVHIKDVPRNENAVENEKCDTPHTSMVLVLVVQLMGLLVIFNIHPACRSRGLGCFKTKPQAGLYIALAQFRFPISTGDYVRLKRRVQVQKGKSNGNTRKIENSDMK